MEASKPAFAIAALLIVYNTEAFTEEQGPAGSFVVIVSVTLPAVISAAEGVYVAFCKVALSNDPVPLVDHVDDVAPPPIEPDNK